MPRLSQDLVRLVSQHNNLRYSHWPKTWIKERKRKVIRLLKRATEDERAAYAHKVEQFLDTNGYNHKQHQG